MGRQTLGGAQEFSDIDKVAVITGAASGLGLAAATVFARAGYHVAALDLGQRPDTPTVDGAGSIDWFHCNVADSQDVERAVQEIIAGRDRIDVLVNCAGIDHTLHIDEMTIGQFDQVIGVNLRGPFLLAKAAWPIMRRQGRGHIVNVASTAALRTWGGASAYHASKFGLLGLSRALGVEGRECGIQVTTIIPGGMRTHFFDRFSQQGIPMPPLETLQAPEDVAQVILFAVQMPRGSVVQEILVTPENETSWP